MYQTIPTELDPYIEPIGPVGKYINIKNKKIRYTRIRDDRK